MNPTKFLKIFVSLTWPILQVLYVQKITQNDCLSYQKIWVDSYKHVKDTIYQYL
jgi:hypothetical protein